MFCEIEDEFSPYNNVNVALYYDSSVEYVSLMNKGPRPRNSRFRVLAHKSVVKRRMAISVVFRTGEGVDRNTSFLRM